MDKKKTKIRVAITLPYLKMRGTEKQALAISQGLLKRGHDVVVFVIQGWGLKDAYFLYRANGIDVVNVGPPLDEGIKSVNLDRAELLASLFKERSCQVILSRASIGNQVSGIAAKMAGIPFVSVLSSGKPPKKTEALKLLKHLRRTKKKFAYLGFPRKIVSVSEENLNTYKKTFPLLRSKIIAIPNGVDIKKIAELSKEKCSFETPLNVPQIAFTGSLEVKRKGIDRLLDALGKMNEEGILFQCHLIGDGPDRTEIEKIIWEKELNDRVTIWGEQRNPFSIMKHCHIFILPSRKEGLPNALLEAMAIGLCCVSANCKTGPHEIFAGGKYGLLYSPEDSQQLSEILKHLFLNPNEINNWGKLAYERATLKYSIDGMIDHYEQLLSKLALNKLKKSRDTSLTC